jgi:epoxyqueuosine reductase QueG
MGLLMTPRLGPRVRIAVVTTDLPLVTDPRDFDPTVLHFCSICRKCAEVCPPGAIPRGERQPHDGAQRWLLDDEACFGYWCAVGTDCGRCLAVCPYSHPEGALHDLVRRLLPRSAVFRRFALRMDDLLYGRRPRPHPVADWLPRRTGRGDG